MENIKAKIRTLPHFPKAGILFRDITTLLKDADAFRQTIDIFVRRYEKRDLDMVAGIESNRGDPQDDEYRLSAGRRGEKVVSTPVGQLTVTASAGMTTARPGKAKPRRALLHTSHGADAVALTGC